MDFDFTREQQMLRDLAHEVLTRRCPPGAVRRWMEDERGYDPDLWHQLAETGLLGIAVDEGHGGQGLGMVELALVLDEMGRAAYPGPYFASAVLAAGALMGCGDTTAQGLYLPGIADGSLVATVAISDDGLTWGPHGVTLPARAEGDEYRLSGAKPFVPWAHAVDVLLVAARTGDYEDPMRGITLFAVERGTPGVPRSTANRVIPRVGSAYSPVRAATRITSAAWAQGTNRFVPARRYSSPSARADSMMPFGPQVRPSSDVAMVATSEPSAMPVR